MTFRLRDRYRRGISAPHYIIIRCWIRYCPHRRSWPDFVWSLSLPRLAILLDHMHPLSPVHFSSSHSLLAFSTFASVLLFLNYSSLQISKPSLSHFHVLSSKHDRTIEYNVSINSSLFLLSNSFALIFDWLKRIITNKN